MVGKREVIHVGPISNDCVGLQEVIFALGIGSRKIAGYSDVISRRTCETVGVIPVSCEL
jgi:hypothetical protein